KRADLGRLAPYLPPSRCRSPPAYSVSVLPASCHRRGPSTPHQPRLLPLSSVPHPSSPEEEHPFLSGLLFSTAAPAARMTLTILPTLDCCFKKPRSWSGSVYRSTTGSFLGSAEVGIDGKHALVLKRRRFHDCASGDNA